MKKRYLKDELESIAQRSIPGDINLWPKISARLERNSPMLHDLPRPFMAILMAGLALLVLSGAVFAIGQTLGYIPGVGLVDNSAGIRILAEPVTITRESVTLTISSAIVYEDRVELMYDVKGIMPENDASQSNKSTDFCGGVNIGDAPSTNGNARLRLPDGRILERDSTGKYPQNAFAMKPVYAARVPADVNSITFLLDCIPQARRGAVPENWVVPLELKKVPVGTVVGSPVKEIQSTAFQSKPEFTTATAPSLVTTLAPTQVVAMNLTKVIPLDTATIFYFTMQMENKDPSLISIMPVGVYVMDAQGQKIQLIGNFTWQPFEHRVGSEFEFTSQVKPADGPLTLVVENAVAYYAPMYVDPRQATPDEMSFTFDAGVNPQYGQVWNVSKTFEIAGYSLEVTSARAASFDDIKSTNFIDGSQGYEYGYDFTVEAQSPVKMQLAMDIISESPACWLSNSVSNVPENNTVHYIQLCRDAYPTGNVRVTIRELSVLVENTWQAVWMP